MKTNEMKELIKDAKSLSDDMLFQIASKGLEMEKKLLAAKKDVHDTIVLKAQAEIKDRLTSGSIDDDLNVTYEQLEFDSVFKNVTVEEYHIDPGFVDEALTEGLTDYLTIKPHEASIKKDFKAGLLPKALHPLVSTTKHSELKVSVKKKKKTSASTK